MNQNKMHNRPIYLNLFRLHLPVTGWVSILHRITGVTLFFSLPVALWLLQRSLANAESHASVMSLLNQPLGKLLGLLVVASLAHHVFSGLRHLALDMHWGVGKASARKSACWVLIASVLVTLLAAGRVFT